VNTPADLTIPLFPLGTVLFPGGQLPLQVFEVRYLDMVKRCQREGTPFGVVCLTQGHEVRQPGVAAERFERVGTLAVLEQVEQPQAGLLVMLCRGTHRFDVRHSERQPNGLWTAQVQTRADDAAVSIPTELHGLAVALDRFRQRLVTEQPQASVLMRQWPTYSTELNSPWQDAAWVANRWAELLPLPPHSKQGLMVLDSPLVRLELVGDALDQLGVPH
jgi:hypothetical protein